VSGLDVDPQMVAIARKRCPGIDIHRADMVHFDLGRRFDVVTCLFSSIGYVQTLTRMRSAIACMAGHLEAGGLLLVEPWLTPEQYRVGEVTANFADGPDLKIAWMYTSDTGNGTSVFDINYLVGSPDGIAYFTERHEMGLFTLREYALSFEAAGVKAERYADSPFGRGLYVGVAEDR
jgi:SAM-dependent methyltransferase